MAKCNGCKNKKIYLECLICQQKADREFPILKPKIVPYTTKIYVDLTLTERMVWATVTAGLITKVTLGKMLHRHPATIWRIYRRAQEKMRKNT